MGATRQIGEWAATVRYEDIPPRLHAKTKAQILSVLAAIHAGRHSEAAQAATETARTWGSGSEALVFGTGERLPRLNAIFANCCSSVAFDFDDYLFAGHTGHSAVCASLAYGEVHGASGRDVLAAMTVANEVGGRLGASLLFGPQNGQMWSYIHLLEGACAVGRLLGLDAGRMTNAIGVAFTQPSYPLMPAFMGPDSKLLIPSSTTVEGAKAAELAARGWTGAPTILEDRQGFVQRFNESNLAWMLSGLGDAWLSDSLTYKVVPGCAYIDTAVDAMNEIMRAFVADNGREPRASDVDDIHVRCGLFTSGMESFSSMYRTSERIAPIGVNFSVALSFGLMLTAGRLAPEFLSHKYLDANKDAIETVAAKVRLEHDTELDRLAAKLSESGGFSLRSLIAGAPQSKDFPDLSGKIKDAMGSDADAPAQRSLRGVSFEGYKMAFPAAVTVKTTGGREYSAQQEIPLGGSGRPWAETETLVREKFRANYTGTHADEAIAAIDQLENVADVREIVDLFA